MCLGLYLAVTIVLSNAYRNSNIYNMIQPRMSVPYENFSQLVVDKFKIFTRLDSAYFQYFPTKGLSNKDWIQEEPHEISFGGDYLNMRSLSSELLKLLLTTTTGFVEESLDNHIFREEVDKLSRLMQHSQLHPELLSTYNETEIAYAKCVLEGSEMENEDIWAALLKKLEQVLLERKLRICDRIAVIWPNYLIWEVVHKMKYVENVYVGKDILQESIIGFDLSGYFPKFQVFSRIKAIEWAGIWQKWLLLVKSKSDHSIHNKKRYKRKPLHKSTILSGNIL